MTDAARGGTVVDADRVDAAHEAASEAVDEVFPEEWKESSSESDFDLIELTLDRMEAAAGAGEWRQAEQARLEAYGFFEFGPEQSLRSLGPELVAEVEGLVWYGAKGEQGYAQLIARKAPRRDFRATRLALDESLEDARGTLGDSASGFSVVTNSALIVFREGLEAVLILAAVTAGLAGAARERRNILFGVALALVASGAHLGARADRAHLASAVRREARGDRGPGRPGRAVSGARTGSSTASTGPSTSRRCAGARSARCSCRPAGCSPHRRSGSCCSASPPSTARASRPCSSSRRWS